MSRPKLNRAQKQDSRTNPGSAAQLVTRIHIDAYLKTRLLANLHPAQPNIVFLVKLVGKKGPAF